MPSWWAKSSSKESKKKGGKESFIDTLHRKFRNPSDGRLSSKSGGSRRHCSDPISVKGSQSVAQSRSSSPSKRVGRCQSFADRPQPLPLPGLLPATVGRINSGISVSPKPKSEKSSKSSLFSLPRPACIGGRLNPSDVDGDLVTASVSSAGSTDSDDPTDSNIQSPCAFDYDNKTTTAANSPSRGMPKEQPSPAAQLCTRELQKPVTHPFRNHVPIKSPKRRPLGHHVPNLHIPYHGAFCSAPDSSISSPSRSPLRAFGSEQVANTTFWAGKPYADTQLLGSGHCSSPGSGQNSGHNSMGGDMAAQFFWQHSRGSPECSPIPSPRMNSPGPSSRIHSGAVTPNHPRAGASASEAQANWPDDGKKQSHRLPLPPITISNSSLFSHSNSAATSPSIPRSPGRAENPTSPGSRWKKGKLLGRGTFGHVYVGFNSESGEMCAMKEVTLFSDDAKSKESAKQLCQEISLLSRLRHPNIVQYYGSESVDDKLYIYLEYVSGGSIYKLLQEYGQLGELAIRSYTQQILSGLAYLHAKNTVHRDIKGANVLVDPNGRVKLADFGMAKHISGQSCPLSFKGSPYWMAPEVIKNSNGCNLAVDIWSLGCTVLEMATTKPPWSQYEGVAAMFKIGNGKERPAIPEHLSEEGKDFIKQCLQRNPLHRPSAAQLLEHPFVKSAAPLERPIPAPELSDMPPAMINGLKSTGQVLRVSSLISLDADSLAVHSSRVSRTGLHSSDNYNPRNLSCPVSPIGSPLLNSRSPQHVNGRMSPSPISSPRTTSGSSTPLTGGNGSIPFHLLKPTISLQEGFGGMTKASSSFYGNGIPFHDVNRNIFGGMQQQGSHAFSEQGSSESDCYGKQQISRHGHGERHYHGQSVLADRVSRQLLRDDIKVKPTIDLSPNSPLPNQSYGI
ncbi:unnamed protein product [Rhodiola kirilowii]